MSINLYRPDGDVAHGVIGLADESAGALFDEWRNADGGKAWIPVPAKVVSKWLIPTDFLIFCGSYLAASVRARDLLIPHLGHMAAFYPLDFPYGEYFWIDIRTLIGSVRISELEGRRAVAPGIGSYWMEIDAWAFEPSVVGSKTLLFSPDVFGMETKRFCNDRFQQIVQDAGLTGIEFVHIWSSDSGPIKHDRLPLLGPKALEIGRAIEARRDQAAQQIGIIYPDKQS